MSKVYTGWHWVADNWKLRDGTPLEVGRTYHVYDPKMCERGLHWSRELLDALGYAPGPVCCRVECWGETVHESEKSVSEYRRVLWAYDATRVLHEFACRCAEHALQKAHVTDERCWQAIRTKRAWLRGNATIEELAATRAAARDAISDATSTAAWAATRDTVWGVASATASTAAWAVAWAAAWDAARASARASAWDAAWAADRAATWAAARDGAWAAQNRLLRIMLQEARNE